MLTFSLESDSKANVEKHPTEENQIESHRESHFETKREIAR